MKRTALRRNGALRRSAPITRRRAQEPAAVRPGSGAKEEPRVPARRSRSGGIKKRPKDPLKAYLNVLFRNIIMHRDKWTCRKCERRAPATPGLRLQCAHILSRGAHPSLTYNPDNALALCVRCHLYWAHKEPLAFADWIRSQRPEVMRNLEMTARFTGRGRPFGLEGVRLFLEQQARHLGAPLPDPPRIAAVRKRA